MLIESLRTFYNKDLVKLKAEVESYRDEGKIWHTEHAIPNSTGNLCLHLVGNLNHFIGAQLGNTGYMRNRDLEFTHQPVPRAMLLKMIEDTTIMVDTVLGKVTVADLQNEYPIQMFENKVSIEHMLVYLSHHLSYHIGQINYHRRLLDIQIA